MIAETRAKLIAAAAMPSVRSATPKPRWTTFTASAGLTRGALYHHFGDKKDCCRRSSPRSTARWLPGE